MMNVQGKFKSSLLPVMLVLGVLFAIYAVADGFSPGFTVSAKLNVTNISVVGKVVQDNAAPLLAWVNVSGTMFFNVTLNNTNGSSSDASWNVTNVSLMFRHNQNESVMGNFTATNNTVDPGNGAGIGLRGPHYWNISVDTTTLPDGIYRLFVLLNNQSAVVAPTGGFRPVTNATLAINVSVDNSPPNSSVTNDATATSQNLTAIGNAAANENVKGFNATVSDASFYYLHPAGAANGTQVANVTFSFDNTTAGGGFNLTVGQGGAAGGQGNMTPTNSTNAIWNVSVNLSGLHAGEHSVRIFAYNWNGRLNNTRVFNFTLNSPHNVTIMSSPTGSVVTQFANFSAGNLSMMFNISVINATNATTGFPNAPINPQGIIFMFDNASGNDFNRTNGTAFVTTTASTVPQSAIYFNVSYNVSGLAEGNNTVTIFVNDTLGNHNKTQKISFVVDKTAPGLTITCSPSLPKEGETVSCTCSAEDGLSGIKENAKFLGAVGASESTVAAGIGSKDTSVCSAVDYAGNRNEKKGSYEVVSAASGGSGGGGSGGGTTSSVGTSGTKKVWASVNAGETATIAVNKEGLAVTAVEVKVDKTVYGAWVIVKSVEKADLPSAASKQLAGKVYDLIEISENKNALKEGTVSERSVAFKVEKSWLSQNGVDKTDVALLRFADNVWTALSTSVTKEDDKVVEYKAVVPGFSYFAIGEKSMATAAPLVEEEPTAAEPSAPSAPAPTTKAAPSEGRSLTWLWVVLVLAVVGVVVYFVQKRK